MTNSDVAGGRSAFWTWVKGVSYSIPWWIAAVSAYFSQEAAFRVFQTENRRLAFETTKYTHDTYRDYVNFRREKRNKGAAACVRTLVERDSNTGLYLVSGDELKWIFGNTPGYVFQYDRRRHGALAACVGDASLKSLFAKDALGTSDEEKAEKAGMIKDAIDDKMAWNVTVLDAELVGYTHEKADKGIICENFVGFIQTDRQLEEMGYGLYGKFLLRLMADEVKLIRRDNYPNISRFTTDLAGISDGFTKHIDCAKLPARPQQDPSRLDWVRALLGRWLG